jgi:hypothetical protein
MLLYSTPLIPSRLVKDNYYETYRFTHKMIDTTVLQSSSRMKIRPFFFAHGWSDDVFGGSGLLILNLIIHYGGMSFKVIQ